MTHRFIELNALRREGDENHRPSPPSTRRLSSLERANTEPDRQFAETPPPPSTPPSTPPPEVTDMPPKKKKRVTLTEEQREIAVARVEKLIEAGNAAGKAVESVAKEFGVSDSAVINWRTAARKTVKKAAKKAAKKTSKNTAKSTRSAVPPASVPARTEDIGQAFVMVLQTAIAPFVRNLVREEIRRALLEGMK